jgi:hypothetical protein
VTMERIALLDPRTSSPPRGYGKPPRKPFAAVDPNINPWSIPREYQDCIPVIYGTIPLLARKLTQGLSEGERFLIIEKRYRHRLPDGRAFKIHLRIKDNNIVPVGGKLWIQDSRGRRATVYDVKSLFQEHWAKIKVLYKDDDLASVMERTRASLHAVGLTPASGDWYLGSAISSNLWRTMGIQLSGIPCLTTRHGGLGNLQGYNVFGHTNDPVYFYDIHSAYMAVLTQWDATRPFAERLWAARQKLRAANDPTERILKLIGTIMPGKFSSTLPGNRYYRPVLGQYIRQEVNDRLQTAMDNINGYYNRYRYCVDGFISNQNIEHKLDIGPNLGQWKPVEKHDWLTIAQTNIWWTNGAHKDNGYPVTREQFLADPEEIHTLRTIFDWSTLSEKQEPVTLEQNHYEERCRACLGDGGELHDTLPKGIYI